MMFKMKLSSGGLPLVALAGFFKFSLNLMICGGGGSFQDPQDSQESFYSESK